MQISYGHYRGIRMSDRIDRLDPQCSRGLARYKQELALRNSRFVLRWSGRATRPIHREQKRQWQKEEHRLGATERPARHFCHQRVQQISQNNRDGHWDQDRLEETNDISAGPNHRADNHDEKNHTEGCESRPHHLALPRRRITAYVRRENVGGHWVGFVFVGGPLPMGAFVLSILFARFLFFGSSASAFCQDSSASERRFNLK